MDVPSDLLPSLGPPTYVPGQIASWDGVNFDLFEPLIGWPICESRRRHLLPREPGRRADDDPAGQGRAADIFINWASSCADGAEDYGIYEGCSAPGTATRR